MFQAKQMYNWTSFGTLIESAYESNKKSGIVLIDLFEAYYKLTILIEFAKIACYNTWNTPIPHGS